MTECNYCDFAKEYEFCSVKSSTDSFDGVYTICTLVKATKDDNSGDKTEHIKKGCCYLEIDGEVTAYVQINYCPMCNRKLGGS